MLPSRSYRGPVGLALAMLLTSCLSPGTEKCSWGAICPRGMICHGPTQSCVLPGESFCGNGIRESTELCDDGNIIAGDGCSHDCRSLEICGNGYVDFTLGEECDCGTDPERVPAGCTAPNGPGGDGTCRSDCRVARCGNALIDPGEICDDGNLASADGCAGDCRSTEVCGNGRVDQIIGELCDDGDQLTRDGCSSTCSGELPIWQTWQSDFRRGRSRHGTAFDIARGRLVLFGGWDGTKEVSDTWEYDGSTWTKRELGSSPPARERHGMAYDANRSRVLLFGGKRSGDFLGDTWEYDGNSWIEFPLALGLEPREHAGLAYDDVSGQVLLFGGRDGSDLHNDTWTWGGATWQQLSPATSPPPRAQYGMAYDSIRGRMVLFGGSGSGSVLLGDTWEFDGVGWVETTPASSPPPLFAHAMTFDPDRGLIVLFGGWDENVAVTGVDETWEYDGAQWSLLPVANPPAGRTYATLAWSTTANRVLLFGGLPAFLGLQYADLWSFDGTAWSDITPSSAPPPLNQAAMVYDPVRRRSVLFGGSFGFTSQNTTWEFTGAQWLRKVTAASPSPRSNHAMTFDRGRQRVVLFGGTSGPVLGDTWEFDGTEWELRTPAGANPISRSNAALGYDEARGVTVLFGGRLSDSTELGDTWEWDGTAWNERTPPSAAPARSWHGMAYDRHRGRMVMFGGFAGLDELDDTWIYDGTNWLLANPAQRPPARTDPRMVYDGHRGRVVMFGGVRLTGQGEILSDTWEFDGWNWVEIAPVFSPPPKLGHTLAYDEARRRVVLFGGSIEGDVTWEYGYQNEDPLETCDNSADDDGDSLIDCDDPDCNLEASCAPTEICDNGIDDDADALVDCADPNCGGLPCSPIGLCVGGECLCHSGTEELDCSDGRDDDCDQLIDCADPDCHDQPHCVPGGECAGYQLIRCGESIASTNLGGNMTRDDYPCGEYDDTGPAVFFAFDGSALTTVSARLTGFSEDLDLIAVGALPIGPCDPDNLCLSASQTLGDEEVVFATDVGSRTYLIVEGFSGATDSFTLTVTCN